MSNSNGTQTLVKSMNGILSFDTGGGVVISGDTIVADTIDLQNLNIDNIQGIAPADNITLYTNTTGNITLGATTTALTTTRGTNIASTATNDITNTATRDNTVKGTRYASLIGENQVFINTNSLSTGTITIDAGSTTNINNGTGKPVNIASLKLNAGTIFANGITDITVSPGTSGALKIAGGQQIEANNNANGFTICNNLTAGNFYLGNSTIGPSTTHDAVNPYELVNYQTALSLVGGGSVLGTNNIFTGTNEFQNDTIISGTTNSMTGNNSISGPTTINGINNSNTSINTGTNAGVVAIGNTSLLSTTILASTINIGNSGNNTINIGSPSGTTLNLRQPITPTYTYGANGTGVGAAIGYVNSSTSTTALVINPTISQMLSFSIPDDGVWMITATVRVQSANATNQSGMTRCAIGLGTTSANYDYAVVWGGTNTVSFNSQAIKSYWQPIITFVGRLAFGASVSLNAEGTSNNGIQAILRSWTYCRIA